MKPIEQQLIIFDIASIQNGFRLNTCRNDPNAGKLSDSRHSGEGQSSGAGICTVHGNKGCNPSQRDCRPLKWIPASALASCFALPPASMQSYAGMTTKNLNLPALGMMPFVDRIYLHDFSIEPFNRFTCLQILLA